MQYLFHWILSGSTVQFIIFFIYLSPVLKMDAYMPYSQNDPRLEQQRIPSVDRQQQNNYYRKCRSRYGNSQKALYTSSQFL